MSNDRNENPSAVGEKRDPYLYSADKQRANTAGQYQPDMNGGVNQSNSDQLVLTVFDGRKQPYSLHLGSFGKNSITFGRGDQNDIILDSSLASAHPHHGRLIRVDEGWQIEDLGSTNGLIWNDSYIQTKLVCSGDLIRIDKAREKATDSVLFIFTSGINNAGWKKQPLENTITIGRSNSCNIVLAHVSVSRNHARVCKRNNQWVIEDLQSTNGVIVNNQQIQGQAVLKEKDVISIMGISLIFTSSGIYYRQREKGISVDVSDVVIRRGKKITGNHISLSIKPGELIAVVGGSGSGKTTILNCMCGYLPPSKGHVYINGTDLYRNFDALKKSFGYVPQADIVYDNLTLWDMLLYTAKLRLPPDVSAAERENAINRAIGMIDMEKQKHQLIRTLSGGQRKRASIAVELLSDPDLLFLDEPTSGLDPGTERELMQSLRKMADNGKTIVLVTHSTLQLKLCNKILFMGTGGNLCYYGNYYEALRFFGVRDIVDVYDLIAGSAKEWKARYKQQARPERKPPVEKIPRPRRAPAFRQLPVLCSRYIKLILNDRKRLLLLLSQAPLLAVLISIVSNGDQFKEYEITRALLFSLSCSAYWVGMLNALQEICKERMILKREYMAGLSLGAYLGSKVIVLGLLCLIQSVLLTGMFSVLIGTPEEGVVFGPFSEMLLTCFLTALAATVTGLFVSAWFTNADRAMSVAPLLLMPQILFSGIFFVLDGIKEVLSWFAVCRWSVEGFGTTANLNSLPTPVELKGIPIVREEEKFFIFTADHFWRTCLILVVYTLTIIILSRIALGRLKKEDT